MRIRERGKDGKLKIKAIDMRDRFYTEKIKNKEIDIKDVPEENLKKVSDLLKK